MPGVTNSALPGASISGLSTDPPQVPVNPVPVLPFLQLGLEKTGHSFKPVTISMSILRKCWILDTSAKPHSYLFSTCPWKAGQDPVPSLAGVAFCWLSPLPWPPVLLGLTPPGCAQCSGEGACGRHAHAVQASGRGCGEHPGQATVLRPQFISLERG